MEHNYLTAASLERFKSQPQTRAHLIEVFKINQDNLILQCGRSQSSPQCRAAVRYTQDFIRNADAIRHFPHQVREARANLAEFPNVTDTDSKAFRWSDYTQGMGEAVIRSIRGDGLPSGSGTGYLNGIAKSALGAARDAQTPGEFLYGSPVGTFSDNQWIRPDPYELNSKQELWGSYLGILGGTAAGRPAIRGRVPRVRGRENLETPPAARMPSPVDGEMVFKPQTTSRGSTRAQIHQNNWQQADLGDAIKRFIGQNPSVSFTHSGKAIYQGQGPIQIVQDINGNYFRIEHTGITGNRRYLDLDGKVPNNKINPDGSQSGRSRSEYNKATHFRIK